MKDNTIATRLERSLATLEILVGRLEHLLGNARAVPAPLDGETTPPVDPDAVKAADEYIARRKAEIEDEFLGRSETIE